MAKVDLDVDMLLFCRELSSSSTVVSFECVGEVEREVSDAFCMQILSMEGPCLFERGLEGVEWRVKVVKAPTVSKYE
jgi:hypothetical protein